MLKTPKFRKGFNLHTFVYKYLQSYKRRRSLCDGNESSCVCSGINYFECLLFSWNEKEYEKYYSNVNFGNKSFKLKD